MNISRIGDVKNWAYDHVTRGMTKYSQNNISYELWNTYNLNQKELIIICSPNIKPPYTNEELPNLIKSSNIKLIGQVCGEITTKYSFVDLIITISPQTYLYAKEIYPNIPVIFLPESCDTKLFTYEERLYNERFKIGFSGGVHKQLKRGYLLKDLNYPIEIKSNHGKTFFKEERPLDDMVSFYKDIDCLISLSTSECMSQSIMQAMASGLPVIATDVGGNCLLLEKEWLIPSFPDSLVVSEMNKKLNILEKNPELRKEVGERNRQFIEREFSWEKNMPLWDKIFELLMNNDIKTILEINDKLINSYGNKFTMNEKYQSQIARFMEK